MPSKSLLPLYRSLRPSNSLHSRSFVARSDIRLARSRQVCTLMVMESKSAFGADNFRKFVAVAQVDHERAPGRREGACILDRELDLQVLVLVVGFIGSGGAPIFLGTSLHHVFHVFVIDQPIAFHHV